MAISRIGSASGTNTCTLPTHQAGDLLIIFAYRDGNTTAPSLPAGWWNISNVGANTNSLRVGYKIAASSGTSAGTWTNATSVIGVVYRGATIGAFSVGGASNTTFSFNGFTSLKSNSWFVGFVGTRDATTAAVGTAPTNMSNVTTVTDATDRAGLHDTNGTLASWSTQTVTTGVAATGWRTAVLELLDTNTLRMGYDTIGITSNAFTDYFVGTSFDCIRNASISSLSWYGKGTSGTVTVDCAIYEETAQNNYTFLAQAQSTISVTSTAGWNTFDLRRKLEVGKRYFIAVWSAGDFTFYGNSGVREAATYATNGNTFNTWPSPESGSPVVDAAFLSMYVTYTRIQGQIDGTSTVTGTIANAGNDGAISGAIAGTSSVSGTIEGLTSLQGTSNGTSTVAGSIQGVFNLVGQIDGTSSVTGTVSGKYLISGTSDGTSSVSGRITGKVNISGEAIGSSTVTGSITATGYILGLSDGSSSVLGVLSTRGRLIGEGVGSSNVSGNLIGYGTLLGAISGTSTVSGSLINFERRRYFIIS